VDEILATESDEAARPGRPALRVPIPRAAGSSPRRLGPIEGYQDVIWFPPAPRPIRRWASLHTVTGLDFRRPRLSSLTGSNALRRPPQPTSSVPGWMARLDDPTTEPTLRTNSSHRNPCGRPAGGTTTTSTTSLSRATVIERLEDHPEAREEFRPVASRGWRGLGPWTSWQARPLRDLYSRLFSIYGAVDTNPGGARAGLRCRLACLGRPDGHPAVQRHLLTSAASDRL